MNTEQLPISQVFPNIGQVEGLPKNPRFIKDEKYKKLVQSIKDDPEMLELRELIVYDTGDKESGYVIIGGNMRYRAMKELGYKEVPCKVLHTGFPVEKMRRIILKDNSSFGDLDLKQLAEEWTIEEIDLSGLDIPDIEFPMDEEPQKKEEPIGEETRQDEPEQPSQRLDSKGEIDVSSFDDKQTLKLDFSPKEYMFVLDRLREFGDDYPQSLLMILGYVDDVDETES